MKQLKILLGGSIREKIHLNSSGGGGVFVSLLGSELAKRGHQVSILGVGGSEVPGCTIIPISQSEDEVMKVEEGYLVHDAYQLFESQWIALNYKNYDVIHINYYHYLFAPFSKLIQSPVVYTEHLPLLTSPLWQQLLNNLVKSEDIFVFVAQHAYNKATLIQNKRVIRHGIDLAQFPYKESPQDYLFWMGRTKKKKGVLDVAQVGLKTKYHVIAAQATKRSDDIALFENEIKPMVATAKNIEFIGPVDHNQKKEYLKNAKAFLMPIHWEEPFGLVMIEALATGTPVIAYGRGSVPEIIKDGETGFIVDHEKGVDGLIEAINKLYSMPEAQYQQMRRNCRKSAEEHYSVNRMIDDYEKLYTEMVSNS